MGTTKRYGTSILSDPIRRKKKKQFSQNSCIVLRRGVALVCAHILWSSAGENFNRRALLRLQGAMSEFAAVGEGGILGNECNEAENGGGERMAKDGKQIVQGVEVFLDDVEDSDEDESPFPKWLDGDSLAPFLPTPGVWLDDLFLFANVSTEDTVCDVGCGDGRIPIWAVQRFQAKCGLGIEIDESLVAIGQQNAKDRKVDDRVNIFYGDATNCGDALDSVTLMICFLLPESLPILKDMFLKHLGKGGACRLVTIGWGISFLQEKEKLELGKGNMATSQYVYLYDKSSLLSTTTGLFERELKADKIN
jgi:hypothetical protein